jgi:hypothetical protein
MAQTNYTPISLYYSTTASAVPTAANLVQGELAINTNDGKLYYEDSSGVVRVLASKSTGSIGGSNTQVQFNNSGSLGGSSGLTWDGSFLTTSSIKNSALTSGRVTYAGASGLLQDSANLLFDGSALTLNGALSTTGRTTINSPVSTEGRLAVRQNNDSNQFFGFIVESNAVPNILAIGYDGTYFSLSASYNGAGAYKPIRITSATNNNVIFNTDGTSTFLTTLSVGSATPSTSGAGITFPATQSASSNANTLDDYEEGTWSPELADSPTGGNAFTMSVQNGLYTKIGNVVTAYFRATWSSKGSASAVNTIFLRGFPFASKSNTGGYYYSAAIIPQETQITIGLSGGDTSAIFFDTLGGISAVAEFSASNSSTGINGSITYLAN